MDRCGQGKGWGLKTGRYAQISFMNDIKVKKVKTTNILTELQVEVYVKYRDPTAAGKIIINK